MSFFLFFSLIFLVLGAADAIKIPIKTIQTGENRTQTNHPMESSDDDGILRVSISSTSPENFSFSFSRVSPENLSEPLPLIALAALAGASPGRFSPVPLVNSYNRLYTGDFSFGTPPQIFRLVLDSGSADTWILSEAAKEKLKFLRYFNGNASITYKRDPEERKFRVKYGKGNVEGFLSRDSLQILEKDDFPLAAENSSALPQLSGSSDGPSNVYLPNFLFGEVYEYSKEFRDPNLALDGILGLAFNKLAKGTENFMDSLKTHGILQERIFSFHLEDFQENSEGSFFQLGMPSQAELIARKRGKKNSKKILVATDEEEIDYSILNDPQGNSTDSNDIDLVWLDLFAGGGSGMWITQLDGISLNRGNSSAPQGNSHGQTRNEIFLSETSLSSTIEENDKNSRESSDSQEVSIPMCQGGTVYCLALFDTGTSFIAIPTGQYFQLVQEIITNRPDCSLSSSSLLVSCLYHSLDHLPIISFYLSDYRFSLYPKDYFIGSILGFMPLDLNSGGGKANNIQLIILGDTFLKEYYTIYDMEEKRIGVLREAGGGAVEKSGTKEMRNFAIAGRNFSIGMTGIVLILLVMWWI